MNRRRMIMASLLAGLNLKAQTPTQLVSQVPPVADSESYESNVRRMNRPDGQTGPILGKPFSAVEVRTFRQTLADGSHIARSERTLVYRDADGRMRDENADHVLIYDPVARSIYNLRPKTKTYWIAPFHDYPQSTTISVTQSGTSIARDGGHGPTYGDLRARQGEGKNGAPLPLSTEELPAQTMDGIFVKGSRVTITVPKGAFGNDRDIHVTNERWYSDDLEALIKSTNSDPRFGVTNYELENITKGEPNPELFRVPSGYTLVEEAH